ncbi:MAG: hypothetical protein DMF62_03760 [Acidobacteria bacterium]|nr:MAG: hypothetical protein DMF62_03760 [Acidobacteriota bacterium]
MKLDPAIVEAVARALARQRLDFNSRHREPLTPERYKASEDAGWPNFVPEANVALTAAIPLIEAAVLEEAAQALAPFARAADVYHEERFAPSDEITGRFGKIVRAEELWCLRNLYTRLRARPFVALKPAPKAQGGKK